MSTKKIQSITGMNDLYGDEVAYWQKLESTMKEIFQNAGYSEIRMPLLEETALFARGIGEGSQVVSKEMYTFEDKGGDSVTLRPEGTASVVRAYIQHSFHQSEEISKLYYLGPMFRYERPQKGRLRQFHQIGVEILGIDSPFADAEAVILVDRIAKAVGVKGYDVQINSLGTLEEREPYLEKLTNYFQGFANELCEDCQTRLQKNVLRIFDCKVERCREICEDAPLLLDELGEDSKRDFEVFKSELEKAGVAFTVNPRIVRGLDYYEKNSFEFVSDKLGSQSAFAGGGRYNRLVEELGGKSTPGVGFSIGCERLVMLMQEDAPLNFENRSGVYFAALDEESLLLARTEAQKLRDAGQKAVAPFVVKSLKAQMRFAHKKGFERVLIIGEDERNSGKAPLKNLETGDQEEVLISELVAKIT